MSVQSRAIFQLERPYAPPGVARQPVLHVLTSKIPTFTVDTEGKSSNVWNSLRTILTPVKLSKDGPRGFLHYTRAARHYFRGRSLSASFVIHCALIFAIIYVPIVMTPEETISPSELIVPEKIYYLPVPKQARELPKIAPPDLGGKPMTGKAPGVPVEGNTVSHSVLSIVSRMEHPDNPHQTIIQPDTPPELRIKNDLKLPNMILGKPLDAPKAPMLAPTQAKPLEMQRKTTDQQAPTVDAQNTINPLMKLVDNNNPHPVLPVSAASGVAAARTNTGSGSAVAPNVSEGATAGDSNVLALVVDPSDSSRVAMPAGNRSGEFSVSSSPVPGSPGGITSGTVEAGAGNHGAGGDLSIGVGRGSSGGGGHSGSVSVSTNVNGPQGTLEAELALKGVYPVPSTFKLRRNTLVISAGPTGGGGLDAYGALTNCGRISTIFLPMPSKNWTMQFCQQNVGAAAPPAQQVSTVIQMQQGIIPPQADTQFDFKRWPVPAENPKQIILKGILHVDGTVDNLQIYQSALPQMDEAARIALSHWKFKPAMRDGKAVPVQILVGIPVDAQPRTSTADAAAAR